MTKSIYTSLFLAATLSIGSAAMAQTAGQDMKNAGSETKSAAKSTGSGIKKGSKTAYRKTKNGTKKAYHKTGKGLAKAGDKIEGKPTPQ